MRIPLEDDYTDILGKAMRGLSLSHSQVAEKAGVDPRRVRDAVQGRFDPELLACIARLLDLNPDALLASAQKAWMPEPVSVPGLAAFTSPFGEMMVNAFLAWDANTYEAVAFDTGADCADMLQFLRDHGLTLRMILLTHTHGDHIFDLDRLMSKTGACAFVNELEPLEGAELFAAGQEFWCGNLQVSTRLTAGHSAGGTTFLIAGLQQPVAVVGDAIFAGSMGGGQVSYADAVRNNREQILTLPEETVLCPGHGPMTTVGEEKRHNPFFA